jgi:ABC-2 type transport system permease protein
VFQYGPKEETFNLFSLGQDVMVPLEFQKSLPFQISAKLVKLLNPTAKVGIAADKKMPPAQFQKPVEQGGLGKDPVDGLSLVRQRIESHLEKIEDVNLAHGTVAESVRTVIVFRPSDLSERAVFEIDQALMRGQNVVLLLDSLATIDIDRIGDDYLANIQANRPIRVRSIDTGLQDWLRHFGLSLGSGYLETKDCAESIATTQEVQMGPGGIPQVVFRQNQFRHPGVVAARTLDRDRNPVDELASNNPIFSGLGSVGFIFPAPMAFDQGAMKSSHPGATAEIVAKSSPDTWRQEVQGNSVTLYVRAQDEKIPASRESFPLIVSMHGNFKSYFAGKTFGEGEDASDRPPRLDAEGVELPAGPSESARLNESVKPAQLWVFADSDFATDWSYINGSGPVAKMGPQVTSPLVQATMSGLINAVDTMTVGPELVAIRKPNLANRTLDKTKMEKDDKSIFFRTAVLGPLIVIGLGLLMWIYRKLTTGAKVPPRLSTGQSVVMSSEERS